jgi:hypothetical protein
MGTPSELLAAWHPPPRILITNQQLSQGSAQIKKVTAQSVIEPRYFVAGSRDQGCCEGNEGYAEGTRKSSKF